METKDTIIIKNDGHRRIIIPRDTWNALKLKPGVAVEMTLRVIKQEDENK